jgi:hypothetical protein
LAEREKAKSIIRDALADVHKRKRDQQGHVIFSLSDEEDTNMNEENTFTSSVDDGKMIHIIVYTSLT